MVTSFYFLRLAVMGALCLFFQTDSSFGADLKFRVLVHPRLLRLRRKEFWEQQSRNMVGKAQTLICTESRKAQDLPKNHKCEISLGLTEVSRMPEDMTIALRERGVPDGAAGAKLAGLLSPAKDERTIFLVTQILDCGPDPPDNALGFEGCTSPGVPRSALAVGPFPYESQDQANRTSKVVLYSYPGSHAWEDELAVTFAHELDHALGGDHLMGRHDQRFEGEPPKYRGRVIGHFLMWEGHSDGYLLRIKDCDLFHNAKP
jgi:hypothetical protein